MHVDTTFCTLPIFLDVFGSLYTYFRTLTWKLAWPWFPPQTACRICQLDLDDCSKSVANTVLCTIVFPDEQSLYDF